MANPLQPKVIKCLEKEFKAYVINITAASKGGHMDIVACIKGLFYGFEIKWKNDKPSDLQMNKINGLIYAGGKGYFIRSVDQLRHLLINNIEPTIYPIETRHIL